MKKLIILFLVVFFNWVNYWYSVWYWNHWVSYTAWWLWTTNITSCNSDWDTTGWSDPTYWEFAVASSNSSASLTPQSGVFDVAASWTMYCLYWDNYTPIWTLSYYNWWSNAVQTILYSANDAWWSKLANVTLQRRQATISDIWVVWAYSWWSNIATNSPWIDSFSANYNQTNTSNLAYQYQVYVQDRAWLNRTITSTNTIYYDSLPPVINYFNHFNWWTNNNNTISYSVTEKWWSQISQIEIQVSISSDSPNFTTWWAWTNVTTIPWNNNYSVSWTISYAMTNHKAYKFRIRATDEVWNTGARINSWETTKFDTQNPSTADIINNTSTDLLAINSQNFSFTVSNANGSPITYIWSFFEDYNTVNSYKSTIETSSTWTWTYPENIQNVDNNRDTNWFRDYSLNVSKICDEAWNCVWDTNSSTSFYVIHYYIYANTTTLDTWTNNLTKNQLWLQQVADWTAKNLYITLKDKYWNQVVPASPIGRTIRLNFDVENTLYLNQYNRWWGSSVFIKWDEIWVTDQYDNTSYNMQNQYSNNWVYNFNFKVYTPTHQNFKADPLWKFNIKNVYLSIWWTIWSLANKIVLNSTNIDFNFKPLYETSVTWEIKDYWFFEWANQMSQISITNNSWVTPSNKKVYLKFWEESWNIFSLKATPPNSVVSEWANLSTIFQNDSWFLWLNKSLSTLLTQDVATLNTSQYNKLYLSSHISYDIINPNWDWTINPVYNSDIIWKSNYLVNFDGIDNATQVWLKVQWIIHDTELSYITTQQQLWDVNAIWNIVKSSLKKDIRGKVYNVVKSITPTNWVAPYSVLNLSWNSWSTINNDWTKLSDVLYFWWLNWANVDLWNWTDLELAWRKTIVVVWWNLYIRSNILNDSDINKDQILWIVVLKDNNNKWWNVYIDPSVKKIVASIYADKSILSYSTTYCSTWEITTSCWWTVAVLKNQLYIKWQIFSENTIWGSRTNPLVCPYYKKSESFLCTEEEAQKYDLNFLRRYFVYDSDNNWTIDSNDNPYWWYWTTNYFSRTSPYYRYPVVIEYNSIIQTTPPPFFGE